MKYALLIYGAEGRWETFSEAEQQTMTEDYMSIGRDPKTKAGADLGDLSKATTVHVDNGKTLQSTVIVDDPGAFNMPWSGVQRWKRIERPLEEYLCEESNVGFFGYNVIPIPTAEKADF